MIVMAQSDAMRTTPDVGYIIFSGETTHRADILERFLLGAGRRHLAHGAEVWNWAEMSGISGKN